MARGIPGDRPIGWEDEMRVGLRGTTRRVWGRRGVKVRQLLQITYKWRYLALVVDPLAGRLWWMWVHRMQARHLARVVAATRQETELAAVVWDQAPGHHGEYLEAVGLPLIAQPAYAPELNPVERVFAYLRSRIEGQVYPTIEAKMAAVDDVLAALDADPERVKSLAGWAWIRQALTEFRQENAA